MSIAQKIADTLQATSASKSGKTKFDFFKEGYQSVFGITVPSTLSDLDEKNYKRVFAVMKVYNPPGYSTSIQTYTRKLFTLYKKLLENKSFASCVSRTTYNNCIFIAEAVLFFLHTYVLDWINGPGRQKQFLMSPRRYGPAFTKMFAAYAFRDAGYDAAFVHLKGHRDVIIDTDEQVNVRSKKNKCGKNVEPCMFANPLVYNNSDGTVNIEFSMRDDHKRMRDDNESITFKQSYTQIQKNLNKVACLLKTIPSVGDKKIELYKELLSVNFMAQTGVTRIPTTSEHYKVGDTSFTGLEVTRRLPLQKRTKMDKCQEQEQLSVIGPVGFIDQPAIPPQKQKQKQKQQMAWDSWFAPQKQVLQLQKKINEQQQLKEFVQLQKMLQKQQQQQEVYYNARGPQTQQQQKMFDEPQQQSINLSESYDGDYLYQTAPLTFLRDLLKNPQSSVAKKNYQQFGLPIDNQSNAVDTFYRNRVLTNKQKIQLIQKELQRRTKFQQQLEAKFLVQDQYA